MGCACLVHRTRAARWVAAGCREHSSTVMNGCLQCACYASFQDLQLSLQEEREVRADLLCTARLLTVTNGSAFPKRTHATGAEPVSSGQEKRETRKEQCSNKRES